MLNVLQEIGIRIVLSFLGSILFSTLMLISGCPCEVDDEEFGELALRRSAKLRLKKRFKQVMFLTPILTIIILIGQIFIWLESVIGVFAIIIAGILILILWKIEDKFQFYYQRYEDLMEWCWRKLFRRRNK